MKWGGKQNSLPPSLDKSVTSAPIGSIICSAKSPISGNTGDLWLLAEKREAMRRRSLLSVPSQGKRRNESGPLHFFLALTLDIVQLRSFLLQLRLQRLRLRFEVSQSLVQRYLLCRHFRGWRGSHIFPLSRKRSAAKRLRAELTADAAVMTSEGEDAPPVSRGGGSCIPVMLPHTHTHTGCIP